MNNSNRQADVVRFGAFEVDVRSGELRKGGLKVRLQDQPFQVLAMLLERPGNLVTREELQKRLWPADTFVDFDQGLGTAIRKLRDALGDSADNPRFIETLPRRGFRFIAPVNRNGGVAGEQAGAGMQQSEVAMSPWRRLPRVAALVTATVLGLVALAYWLRPSLPSPKVLGIVQLTHDRRPKLPIMVTDGPRLYFTEQIGDHLRPYGMSTAGRETIPIATPFQDAAVLDISADGSELLIQNGVQGQMEPALWAVPVSGGSPRRLVDLQASEATWSPDGKKIIYIRSNDHQLYITQSDGTGSRTLVTVPGKPYFIRWSPDGKRISLSVENGNSHTLWEVSADGSNLHPILPAWTGFFDMACSGHWTLDGKYFLFDSYRSTTTSGSDNIWVIPEKRPLFTKANHEPHQLTTETWDIGKPVPAKDGSKIFALSNQASSDLVRYDSRSQRFVPFLPGISAWMVDFSRDGKWIAYVTIPEGNLFRSKADGSQRLQLTFAPLTAENPSWSPDGGKIAFSGQAPGKPKKIFLISAKGGNLEQLTQGGNPTWSPDGNWLAFGSGNGINLLDLRTRQVSTLPGSEEHYGAEWSPKGRYLAAQKGDEDNLALFDFATRGWQDLPKALVGREIWSRDGRYLYFTDFLKEPSCLRIRISDGKLERVASLKGPGPNWWMGLTPDDSPLMLSNVGFQEIYALDWDAP